VGAPLRVHDGAEELFLVLEVDVEGALGHARHPGDLAHAGALEAALQEHRASAIHDLAPLGGIRPGPAPLLLRTIPGPDGGKDVDRFVAHLRLPPSPTPILATRRCDATN
jgi:hypothetical protein